MLKWSLSAWEAKVESRETVVIPELFGLTFLPMAVTVILVSKLCPRMNVLLVRLMAVVRAASACSLLALYQLASMAVLA